jgi:dimethylargininase
MNSLNFTHAITREPCENLADGETSKDFERADPQLARQQHRQYRAALKQCGLQVRLLESAPDFPDSTFVEDVALLTPYCSIITRPGAPSRRDETVLIKDELEARGKPLEAIESPGTLDAGDVMQVGSHYYVGLSSRSNQEGCRQLLAILRRYGLDGSMLPLPGGLHLKSSIAYLENNHLLLTEVMTACPEFSDFEHIVVESGEEPAANSLWLNGTVLVPAAHPKTAKRVQAAGYPVIALDVSEFDKVDGGLSCLSLRY